MATRDITTDDLRIESSRPRVTRREETKASFLTTEFWAMIGVIAAISSPHSRRTTSKHLVRGRWWRPLRSDTALAEGFAEEQRLSRQGRRALAPRTDGGAVCGTAPAKALDLESPRSPIK